MGRRILRKLAFKRFIKNSWKFFKDHIWSRKFCIALSVTVVWTVLIILGKWEVAVHFNNVVISVDVAYIGSNVVEKHIIARNGKKSSNDIPQRGTGGVV